MSFLTGWVTNIIVLIMLASIIELLLPNNQFQKYIKLVVGLLLILAMLNPILQLFHSDVSAVFKNAAFENSDQSEMIKNSIDLKKKEIQASDRAYILEQMAVQMKKKVKEGMKKSYGVDIVNLVFTMNTQKNPQDWTPDDIAQVKVVIGKEKQQSTDEVQEVVISVDKEKAQPSAENDLAESVRLYLANQWQLDEKQLDVVVEGGEEPSS